MAEGSPLAQEPCFQGSEAMGVCDPCSDCTPPGRNGRRGLQLLPLPRARPQAGPGRAQGRQLITLRGGEFSPVESREGRLQPPCQQNS